MSAEYSPFARPKFTADDFARNDETGRFDDATQEVARPRAPIEETRTFMADDDRLVGSDPVMESELYREDEMLLDRPVETETPMFAAAPIYAGSTKSRSASTDRKIPKAALIAVPAVVLLAGVGYMAMTSGADQGIAQKAPGATTAAATTPAAPSFSEPTDLAAATPAPIAPAATPAAPPPTQSVSAPRATARVDSTPTRVARARPAPAAAATASSAGVDSSATLPSAPVPYSGSAQTAAPATIIVPPPFTAAEPVNPVPPAVTPAPEPSTPQTSTPEAITPPTL